MYSSFGKGIVIITRLLLILLSAFASLVKGSEIEADKNADLIAQPANCVALTQGRKCFAQVSIHWRAQIKGDYCIYRKNDNALIQCWQGTNSNTALLEFESSETVIFELVDKNKKVIAHTQVEVSWVHKASPRKRRWRLF